MAGALALTIASAAASLLWAGAKILERGVEAGGRWRDLSALSREASRADTLIADYRRLDSALGAVGKGLPAGSEGGRALEILVAEAKNCSLGIAQLQALEEKPHGAYRELPFALKATGDLPRLHRFLAALDGRPWAMRAHAWSIKSKAMHRQDLEASLEFSVFTIEGPGGNP